jgi:hypothetical protein
MHKRVKVLFGAAIILLSSVLALVPRDASAGAQDTLLSKQIIAAFNMCVRTGDIYGIDGKQSLDELRGGTFFGGTVVASGFAVEAKVGGEAKDGSITCSEKSNALAKLYFSHFGLGVTDDFITASGVFKPSGGYFALDTSNGPDAALNWIANRATTNKVTTLQLTDEEKYYMHRQFLDSPECRSGAQTSTQIWQVGSDGVPSQVSIYYKTNGMSALGNPSVTARGDDMWALSHYGTCSDSASWLGNAANIAPRLNLRLRATLVGDATSNVQLSRAGTAVALTPQMSWGPSGPWTTVTGVTVTGNPSWLIVNVVGSTVNVSSSSSNNGAQQRDATITLHYTNTTFGKTQTTQILVSQPGTATLDAVLEPDNLVFDAAGGSRTYTFRVREPNEEAYQDVSPSSVVLRDANGGRFVGRNGATIEIEVDANTDPDARSPGTLEITYAGQTYSFRLTQEGLIAPPGGIDGESPASECQLGKMGWALCPLLSGLDSILGGLYGAVIEPFLQIDVEFYRADPSNGTYAAWSVFRNIANIVFVIVFLIVILSQVTNIGINNYGIKKMLPEIITAAILINLSFFICQAMVDLSNILGSQLKDLLDGIATTIAGANPAPPESEGGLAIFLTVLGVGGATVAAFSIAAVMMGGIGAVFAGIALFLLAGVIAALMLFVMLVIRQMGVIVFVAIAPLAFAARILPNTQGLFKSWWKMFTVLLLVYPMCGLVLGAGKLAGTIIAASSNGNWLIIIGALIAMIAPYFFVITLIKGSLSGLGKLGSAITGRVNGVTKMGQNAVNKSSLGQNLKAHATAGLNARTNAKAAKAKSIAEQRSAKMAAGGKGVFGKAAKAEFEAGQTKDDAAMASVGEYNGTDERMQKLSRANAIRLGNYKPGGTAYEADLANAGGTATAKMTVDADRSRTNATNITAAGRDSYEAKQQRDASTALLQQDDKLGKSFAEGYALQDAATIAADVMDGTALKAGVTDIQAEQAIKALIGQGQYDKAEELTKAYTASGTYKGTDARVRNRLANVLQSGNTKAEAAHLNAYGKMVGKGAAGNYETAVTSGSLNTEIQNGSYNMASQDADTITSMMKEPSLKATMLGKLTPQNIGQMNSKQFNAVKEHLDGKAMAGVLGTDMSEERQTAVNTMLAADAAKSNAAAEALSAQQMSKVSTDTFATMASHALGRTVTAADLPTLSAADKTTLRTTFKSSSDSMALNPDVAKHWNADIQNILSGGGRLDASPQSQVNTPPTISFQRTEDHSFTDTATGVRQEEVRNVDLPGQEIMRQVTQDYAPRANETVGSRQYYQGAMDRLSTEQLGQIIQRDNQVNANGSVTDQHYRQLRDFAEKSLASRGETMGARVAQMDREREAQNRRNNPNPSRPTVPPRTSQGPETL